MRLFIALPILFFAAPASAQSSADSAAIRTIVANEIETWNKGDAVGYSRDFAANGTFTNIRGQFFSGYPAYLKQHEVIFQGIFKGTVLKMEIASLKFVRPDVAIVETACLVTGAGPGAVGVTRDDKGRIRTRLLQVVAKEGGVWKIVTYHNVDVKPEIPFPEPK